jgi:DNA processing protein
MLALAATPGPLPAVVASRLAGGRDPAELLRPDSPEPGLVAARLDELGLRFVLPGDPGWPFGEAPPEPPCAWLFVDGPDPPGPGGSVAVVGGRRASPLRRAAARSLAAGLASAGWCVVSGGAAGVDAAAHAGALDAGGRTVVVAGCGLDVAYPRANADLLARVRAGGGTLVGEHPPGARPHAAHFLPRNRLIAALADAVVVVEARDGSGSLSTARAAGSRGWGRVLAVPGAPWDPGAAGCNALIRDGATLVRGLDDVLEELGLAGGMGPYGPPRRRPPPGMSPDAHRMLGLLVDGQPLPLSRLAALTGLPPGTLAAALAELELAGFAHRSAAGVQAIAMPLETAAPSPATAHGPAALPPTTAAGPPTTAAGPPTAAAGPPTAAAGAATAGADPASAAAASPSTAEGPPTAAWSRPTAGPGPLGQSRGPP